MAKQKIKPKQHWVHTPSGGVYEVISIGETKLPHIGWFKSVTYVNEKGKVYTRFIEDFENKFEITDKKAKLKDGEIKKH